MPVQTKTLTQLVNKAAAELRLIDASGDTLAAEDRVLIEDMAYPVLYDLDARGIVSIPDAEAIPLTYFMWVAKLLAIASEADFGKPPTPDAVRESYEDKLRIAVNNEGPTNRYLRVDSALQQHWWPYTLLNGRSGT